MQELNISYSSLLRVLVVILGLAFLFFIRDVLVVLFLSLVLSAALDPLVAWFEKHDLPRSVGIIAVYLVLFIVIGVTVIATAPAITNQIKSLSTSLPSYYTQLLDKWSVDSNLLQDTSAVQGVEAFSQTLNSLISNVIPALRGLFGGGFTFFLILVLTFYLSVEDRGLKRFFRSTLPVKYQPYFNRTVNKIQFKMGRWLRGQLFLSLIVFILTAVFLFVLHLITNAVPYWLVLALIAGFLEVIPVLGPFIAGFIGVLLVLGNSFWIALIVLAIYIIVQQLENNILVPKVMQRTVGLNPIIVILVIVIGSRLAGILGTIIAIPLAAAIQVFLSDVMASEEESKLAQVKGG